MLLGKTVGRGGDVGRVVSATRARILMAAVVMTFFVLGIAIGLVGVLACQKGRNRAEGGAPGGADAVEEGKAGSPVGSVSPGSVSSTMGRGMAPSIQIFNGNGGRTRYPASR